jgi:hypothetical protein
MKNVFPSLCCIWKYISLGSHESGGLNQDHCGGMQYLKEFNSVEYTLCPHLTILVPLQRIYGARIPEPNVSLKQVKRDYLFRPIVDKLKETTCLGQ